MSHNEPQGTPYVEPQGAPYAPGPAGEDPGKTMGIVGLVLAIFCSLIGLIVSIIAYNKSKKAGFKNNIALAGIIVGIVSIVLAFVLRYSGAVG